MTDTASPCHVEILFPSEFVLTILRLLTHIYNRKLATQFRIDPTIPISTHTYRPGECKNRNLSSSTESSSFTIDFELESLAAEVELNSLIAEVDVKFAETHCTSTSEKKIGPV